MDIEEKNLKEIEKSEYMRAQAEKVQVYISELRQRLFKLKSEEEEIERTANSILYKQENSMDESLDLNFNKSNESTKKQETINENSSFKSILEKFRNLEKPNDNFAIKKESEEISQLKEMNYSIRQKIQLLQTRIAEAQKSAYSNSNRILVEETCSRLLTASEEALRKIDQIEEEIKSVASLIFEKLDTGLISLNTFVELEKKNLGNTSFDISTINLLNEDTKEVIILDNNVDFD